MANVALYRKYRSRDFNELIGQEHITTSLENAIKNKRIGHAYLFTGPHGTGKTSAARILARRVNNFESSETEHLDIIEIDAASNRRIDEIRELREKVHIAPAKGTYKVYIIDEVHMLTRESFNALLKTLEEPPAHAIFILATTEPHKLPDTIISRTQRYSFRPIGIEKIKAQLENIAKKEGFSVEDAALELIARAGNGSFRDSISLLDQVASSEGKVTKELVADSLGYAKEDLMDELSLAIVKKDHKKLLDSLNALWASGAEPEQVQQQLLIHWRKLMHINLGIGAPASDAQNEIITLLEDSNRIVQVLDALSALPKNSSYLDIALEAALLKLMTIGPLPTVVEIEPLKQAPKTKNFSEVFRATVKPKEEKIVEQQAPAAGSSLNFNDIWIKTLSLVKGKNSSLYALLRGADPDFSNDQLVLRFKFQFHRRKMDEDRNKLILEEIINKIYGKKIKIKADLIGSNQSVDTRNNGKNEQKQDVSAIIDILGGEVI